MDGDLIQGALQSLLQNREQMSQRQQQAQQQHIQTMQTPLPQTSPIQSMVSDYLQKYAQNPSMSWSAMASAVGGQTERDRKGLESQLLRQEAANAQEAKYAGEALKEEDLFGRGMMGGRGLAGRQPSPEQLRTVYTNSMNHYAQIAKDLDFNKMDPGDPGGARTRWIQEQTDKAVQNYIDKFATQPLGPRGLGQGETTGQSQQKTPELPKFEPLPELPKFEPRSGVSVPTTAEQNAKRNIGLIQTELQRPENQSGDRKLILEQELVREQEALKTPQTQTAQSAPSLPPTPTSKTAPAGLETAPAGQVATAQQPLLGGAVPPQKDVREGEQRKSYGKEEGQELFKERKALDTLYGANTKLVGQLNMLENIYSNPNIPEGELAGQIAAFRSGMKSLGVEVSDKAGLTDLAKAVSTGLALTQRTADGQNLLPGAMSNYEDQLLQKMAPTLNLTNQGRVALIQMMKQMAQANLRIAEEGTKMASANKDMLPADWYKRKERIMLEEMARMKMMSDKLVKQYGGKR